MNKLIALFLILAFTYQARSQRTCQEVLAVAESFMIDGNVDNVKKILNQTRGKCDTDVAWYYIQFGYQSAINEIDSTNFYMLKAAKLFPKNDSIQYLLAKSYLLYYDSAEALSGLRVIDLALKLKEKPTYLLCKIGRAHV